MLIIIFTLTNIIFLYLSISHVPTHFPPKTVLACPTCMDTFEIMTSAKIIFSTILHAIPTTHSSSHEKSSLLITPNFMFSTTIHHFHYHHKTTHFFIRSSLNQFHLQHFIFLTTFSPLNTLQLNCMY